MCGTRPAHPCVPCPLRIAPFGCCCCRCLCKLLDGIQDHYTYAQPGIQRTVFRLKELVRRASLN